MKFTMKQFNERFPTSDACLEELKQHRYSNWNCPKCGSPSLSKINGRAQYASPCGFQVAPLAGTIFHKSSTDLRTWFMTIFLMTTTRSGVSAKTVERITGTTYKTAWRMMKRIRTVMVENGDDLLGGTIEVDETYVGGVRKGMRGRNPAGGNKTPVFGMLERGGRVRTAVVDRATAPALMPHVQANVSRGSNIVRDQLLAYNVLPRLGYGHESINHSKYYSFNGINTNPIEGFWSILKNGITAVYRHVDREYLPFYAAEYAWRYSYRKSQVPMFELLLKNVCKAF